MINVKKGPAHSLLQSDKVAPVTANEAVVAGMICRIDATDGKVKKGGAATDLFGFAINNQDDGDVIEAGKIGLYLLDGGSVIETDQAAATINSTNYPVGTPLYPAASNTGKVSSANTVAKVIGWVEGIRDLPSVEIVGGVKVQLTRSLLGIKLAA